MNNDFTPEEIAAHRKRMAKLFEIDQAGLTENYIRDILKIRTPEMYNENTINMAPLLELCDSIRGLAPRSLPNGEVLNFTRAEIEAHFGEPVDWFWFCGMREDQRGKLPPIYFFRDPDKNPRIKSVTPVTA